MYKMPASLSFDPVTKTGKFGLSNKADSSLKDSKQSKTKEEAKVVPAVGNRRSSTIDAFELTRKNLQEAIIWSEIIGKPMCKRRKRRYYGN